MKDRKWSWRIIRILTHNKKTQNSPDKPRPSQEPPDVKLHVFNNDDSVIDLFFNNIIVPNVPTAPNTQQQPILMYI